MLIIRLLLAVLLAAVPLGCCTRTSPLTYAKRSAELIYIPNAVKWRRSPIIQVCDSAPVTKDEVELVLAEWAEHGAPQLRVVESKCKEEMPSPGFVQIDKWRPQWRAQIKEAHAVTAVWPEAPEAGLIMLPDSSLAVLRHEVGHIWIQGHANKSGHVICPFVECMGNDWSGIKKSFKNGGH